MSKLEVILAGANIVNNAIIINSMRDSVRRSWMNPITFVASSTLLVAASYVEAKNIHGHVKALMDQRSATKNPVDPSKPEGPNHRRYKHETIPFRGLI